MGVTMASAGEVAEVVRRRLEVLGSTGDPGERAGLWIYLEGNFATLDSVARNAGEGELEGVPGLPQPIAAYLSFSRLAGAMSAAEWAASEGLRRMETWLALEENVAARALLDEAAAGVTGARAVEVFTELQGIVRSNGWSA
jgi:hypothetical protein